MTVRDDILPRRRPPAAPSILVMLLAMSALATAVGHLTGMFPAAAWRGLFSHADYGARTMVLYYSALPRLAVSLLAGAALGLAGAVMQTVLRNPLAEPTTLGVSAGASLALTGASLWAPGLIVVGREAVAIFGSAVAMLAVVGLAWARGLSPVRLILAGLIVSLYFGALTALLALFHHDALQGIFLWGAGSLVQNDWGQARFLLTRLVTAAVIILVLIRPLSVLTLDDEKARSLGLSLPVVRTAALGVTVMLSASVVSAVGVIGFVGLAGSALARLAGARTLPHRFLVSALIGALLLSTADQGLQWLSGPFVEVPAGSLTALLGAPFILWLLPRMAPAIAVRTTSGAVARSPRGWTLVALLGLGLAVTLWPVLALGRSAQGWQMIWGPDLGNLLIWRWPRTLAAVSAGALLGMSGVLTQRLTSNPLSSPEVLGISSGASLGTILCVFAFALPSRQIEMAGAAGGGFATLALLFAFSRKASFSPDRMLLAGVAISTVFSGIVGFLMTTGDPRMRMLLTWMAGSIARVAPDEAVAVAVVAALAVAITPLPIRWLSILPLGEASALAIGMNVRRARWLLCLLIAVLTAVPAVIIGPLSFVGLMSPHIVRMAGIQRPLQQCLAAAMVGALILAIADWLGRILMFPYQIPAGLLATFVGGPYFLWLLRKERR